MNLGGLVNSASRCIKGDIAFRKFEKVSLTGKKITLGRRLCLYEFQVVSVMTYPFPAALSRRPFPPPFSTALFHRPFPPPFSAALSRRPFPPPFPAALSRQVMCNIRTRLSMDIMRRVLVAVRGTVRGKAKKAWTAPISSVDFNLIPEEKSYEG